MLIERNIFENLKFRRLIITRLIILSFDENFIKQIFFLSFMVGWKGIQNVESKREIIYSKF